MRRGDMRHGCRAGTARIVDVSAADDARRERGMVALSSRSLREGEIQLGRDRQALWRARQRRAAQECRRKLLAYIAFPVFIIVQLTV